MTPNEFAATVSIEELDEMIEFEKLEREEEKRATEAARTRSRR